MEIRAICYLHVYFKYYLKQGSTGQNKCIVHQSQLKSRQQLVFFNSHYAFSVTIKPCEYYAC